MCSFASSSFACRRFVHPCSANRVSYRARHRPHTTAPSAPKEPTDERDEWTRRRQRTNRHDRACVSIHRSRSSRIMSCRPLPVSNRLCAAAWRQRDLETHRSRMQTNPPAVDDQPPKTYFVNINRAKKDQMNDGACGGGGARWRQLAAATGSEVRRAELRHVTHLMPVLACCLPSQSCATRSIVRIVCSSVRWVRSCRVRR